MTRAAPPLSSNQPHPPILHILAALQRVCLLAVILLSGFTLAAWILPSFGKFLPAAWDHMKANTSFCVFLSALSLNLSRPGRSWHKIGVSRALSILVILISAVTIVERLFNTSTWVDNFLTAHTSAHVDRPTPQIAYSFLLIGVLTLFMRVRKSVFAHLVDAVTFALAMLMLVFVAGYLFFVLRLFGAGMYEHFSPQTLFSLVMLSFVAFNRRTEYGVFSILLGDGIGGKIARLASPFALILPLVLSACRDAIIRFHILQTEYATAVTAAASSLFAFCLIIALSRRIDSLEKNVRALSLRDELTGLYNRRGFYVLAEQALRLTHRAGGAFSVIFIDIDNLKKINDAQGHEVGSLLLREMASILRSTFQETDVLGRLGGDEFVVAGKASAGEIARAAHRLEDAVLRANAVGNRHYSLGFSSGYVTSDDAKLQTLDSLLKRADLIMYESKRLKKFLRPPTHNELTPIDDRLVNLVQ